MTTEYLRYAQLECAVIVNGKRIRLPHREREVIEVLSKHPNRVYNREQLEQLTGSLAGEDDRDIDGDVKRLRARLKRNGVKVGRLWPIETVYGIGYCAPGIIRIDEGDET